MVVVTAWNTEKKGMVSVAWINWLRSMGSNDAPLHETPALLDGR